MTDMPEKLDRARLLLLLLAVVVGLAVASIPLMASIFSEPNTTPAAAPSSTGAEPANKSAADEQTPPADNRVTVDNVVPCVEPKGDELASDEHNTMLAGGAELADVHLPCLTDGGEQNSQSLAEQFAGTPTVVNVWAWWCGPCRKELPVMQQVAESNPQWNVVGVHLDARGQAGVDFLDELGVDNLPSYQDANHTFDTATSIPKVVPVTLVYRADGTRAATFVRTFDDSAEMQQKINEALAG